MTVPPEYARLSAKLLAEIESVTPSWNDVPERLPKRAVPVDEPHALPAVEDSPVALPLPPLSETQAVIRAALTVATEPLRVNALAGLTGLPLPIVYRFILQLYRKGEVVRTLDTRARYKYALRV